MSRYTYLTGRWLGTLAFLWSFQLIGMLFALGMARVWHAPFTPMLWLGCLQGFIAALYFSGVSLGLSVVMTPVLAGGLAFLLTELPSLVAPAIRRPHWWVRALANAAYYVSPADMPEDPISESFSKGVLHPAYALYSQVLVENLLYAIILFGLACAILARKELRLR